MNVNEVSLANGADASPDHYTAAVVCCRGLSSMLQVPFPSAESNSDTTVNLSKAETLLVWKKNDLWSMYHGAYKTAVSTFCAVGKVVAFKLFFFRVKTAWFDPVCHCLNRDRTSFWVSVVSYHFLKTWIVDKTSSSNSYCNVAIFPLSRDVWSPRPE